MTAAVKVGDAVLYVADECYRGTYPPYPTFVWKATVAAVYEPGRADLDIYPPGNFSLLHSGGVLYDASKRPHTFHLDTDNGRD